MTHYGHPICLQRTDFEAGHWHAARGQVDKIEQKGQGVEEGSVASAQLILEAIEHHRQ